MSSEWRANPTSPESEKSHPEASEKSFMAGADSGSTKGSCPMHSCHVACYGRTGKYTSRDKHERLCLTAHDHLVQLHFVCISSKWLKNMLGIVIPLPVLRMFWQEMREAFGAKDLKNSGPDFKLLRFEVILCWKFGLDTSLVVARIRQNLQKFGSIPSARNYQFPYFCCSWCFWHPGTNNLHLNEMRKVSPANYAISFPHYVFLHLLAALLQNQRTVKWNCKDNNFNGKKLGTGRWHRLHWGGEVK